MLVFDTSAFLNGWNYHYKPKNLAGVWSLLSDAMGDGRVIAPRAVLRELQDKDDEVSAWATERQEAFVDPSELVQARAGLIYDMFPPHATRDPADPFVVAEAELRQMTVVTYEGQTFSGVPTRDWTKTMPGICQHLEVPCLTLPDALDRLGLSLT